MVVLEIGTGKVTIETVDLIGVEAVQFSTASTVIFMYSLPDENETPEDSQKIDALDPEARTPEFKMCAVQVFI